MEKKKRALLNNFATRSFRDIADQDYISARLSFRHALYPQFLWQALQAIEKYLKAILLYNKVERVKKKNIGHDLILALEYCEKLPFELKRSEITDNFIEYLAEYGKYRYLEGSYTLAGPKLAELDKAVWEIRRYCRVIDYEIPHSDGSGRNMLQSEINIIENSENQPPQKFRISDGLLERIINNQNHPARAPLVWQNLFFGNLHRKKVCMPTPFISVNAPLLLHPEVLDDALDYVYLPGPVIKAYRELLQKKQKVSK